MNVIQRLLVRDDIDALEVDLERAREREPEHVARISAEIARLERLINQRASEHQRVNAA